MASADFFNNNLGIKVGEPEEETFILFSQGIPSQDLGCVDSSVHSLELTVAGKDLTIYQSPNILSSKRSGGTTGAVVWKVTPLFAEWAVSSNSILSKVGIINTAKSHEPVIATATTTILELGCGISAIVGLVLAPLVGHYILTDQPYVDRLVERNIQENLHVFTNKYSSTKGRKQTKAAAQQQQQHQQQQTQDLPLRFAPLDWESDEASPSLTGHPPTARSFDAVIACDCVYNESLVEPFVQTCVDVCALRASDLGIHDDDDDDGGSGSGFGSSSSLMRNSPCLCIVAQQLRSPDVFETFLKRFHRSFHVWRVPDDQLLEGLRSDTGFVVHLGLLR